jgi:hypothetical protein
MKTYQKPLISGFGAETTAEEIAAGINLRGKVCVITRGHSGIGPVNGRNRPWALVAVIESCCSLG